jgi:small conductance mechanosensitive channel
MQGGREFAEGAHLHVDLSKINIEQYVVSIAGALAILIIGWMLAGWTSGIVRRATTRSGHISPTLIPLFAKLARLTILSMVILAALHRIGVETSGVFAMIGAAGLAIGLALKDTVADVAAGIVLLILRPFDVGEAVKIGANGGTVNAIDIFQTQLTSFDGIPYVINNSAVRTAVIQNFSRSTQRRIEMDINIGFNNDVNKAISGISAIIEADARVQKEPGYLVHTKALTDSAVVLTVRCSTKPSDMESTQFDLTRAIKERFDREGIKIPAPHRQVNLTQPQSNSGPQQISA